MDDFNNIPPELSKIGNQQPYNVPDNYFETFSNKMAERIVSHKKSAYSLAFISKHVLKPYLIVASFVVIFGMSWIVFSKMNRPQQNNNLIAAVDSIEMQEKLLASIDETTVLEYVAAETNQNFLADKKLDTKTEDIINYLSETNVDESSIGEIY